jgi:hypothetical protein
MGKLPDPEIKGKQNKTKKLREKNENYAVLNYGNLPRTQGEDIPWSFSLHLTNDHGVFLFAWI